MVEAVKTAGGVVVGVGALANRGGVTAEMIGAPLLRSIIEIRMNAYEAHECPLCKKGVPVNTDVGHGAQFTKTREQVV